MLEFFWAKNKKKDLTQILKNDSYFRLNFVGLKVSNIIWCLMSFQIYSLKVDASFFIRPVMVFSFEILKQIHQHKSFHNSLLIQKLNILNRSTSEVKKYGLEWKNKKSSHQFLINMLEFTAKTKWCCKIKVVKRYFLTSEIYQFINLHKKLPAH